MPNKPSKDFPSQLCSLGLCGGDTVLVHSSMKALGTRKTPEEVIGDLVSAIGPEGTLLFPALTYDTVTAKNPHFSVRENEPCIGLLPKTFFRMEGVSRSVHPTHSVCAFGKNADVMTCEHHLDETPVGPHSPFMKLLEHKGKILFIGDTVSCCTFLHGLEEIAGAPYVLQKERTHYTIEDKDGNIIERSLFAHDFSGWEQEYHRIKNIAPYKTGKVGGAECFLFDAAALAEKALEKFRENIFYFVSPLVSKSS